MRHGAVRMARDEPGLLGVEGDLPVLRGPYPIAVAAAGDGLAGPAGLAAQAVPVAPEHAHFGEPPLPLSVDGVAFLEYVVGADAVVLLVGLPASAHLLDAVIGLAGAPVGFGHFAGVNDVLAPVARLVLLFQPVFLDLTQQPRGIAYFDQVG